MEIQKKIQAKVQRIMRGRARFLQTTHYARTAGVAVHWTLMSTGSNKRTKLSVDVFWRCP